MDESLTRARGFLHGARNPDGSLGHLAGQPGHLEPTLLAVAAGGVSPPLPWLAAQPWGWGKLLMPAILYSVPEAEPMVEAAVAAILAREGEIVEDEPGWLGFDPSLSAWPWVDGTAPWVEPTAYALLSLKRAGRADHPRVASGEALLRDRQCRDGGWNYGNPAVLGAELESDLSSTGWATLALPSGPEVQRALTRMEEARVQRSTSTLALAILAHHAHGSVAPADMVELLLARQRDDGSFAGRCDWTALAACALAVASGEAHPLAVPA